MTKLRNVSVWLVAAAAGVAWACAGAGPAAPTAEEARKFLDDANETMLRVSVAEGQAGWVAQTYITDDTEAISARANQAFSDAIAKLAKDATRFDKLDLPPDLRRQLNLLKLSLVLVTPADPKEAEELTTIAARLEATYGKGKWCEDPAKPDTCLDIEKITEIMADSRDPKRAARGLGRLAHDFAADEEGLRALRRAVEQGRARSWALPTPARCGARSTTCRPTTSRRSSIGCGSRCGRSTCRCTPTCA